MKKIKQQMKFFRGGMQNEKVLIAFFDDSFIVGNVYASKWDIKKLENCRKR